MHRRATWKGKIALVSILLKKKLFYSLKTLFSFSFRMHFLACVINFIVSPHIGLRYCCWTVSTYLQVSDWPACPHAQKLHHHLWVLDISCMRGSKNVFLKIPTCLSTRPQADGEIQGYIYQNVDICLYSGDNLFNVQTWVYFACSSPSPLGFRPSRIDRRSVHWLIRWLLRLMDLLRVGGMRREKQHALWQGKAATEECCLC